ncbi:kelch protein, putative [Plasmodium gaboni]|uniref:Kelch protein, putative n=1 Tax=Plasmodium gaboni TaxID=647221 RepID=A0ABY1UPA0_9APIC|nr:kelch protein, putative [Plasmodium gaboni]
MASPNTTQPEIILSEERKASLTTQSTTNNTNDGNVSEEHKTIASEQQPIPVSNTQGTAENSIENIKKTDLSNKDENTNINTNITTNINTNINTNTTINVDTNANTTTNADTDTNTTTTISANINTSAKTHDTRIQYNGDVSKAFLSPPVFHLTEIMHDERCFKKTKGHVTVEINGDICIYGGMLHDKCIENFIRYVPGINLFEKMRLNSNDIVPRAFCSGNVITEDNKKYIIIFGGINEKDEIIDETYKFDFQAKKWELIGNKLCPRARYKHASFSFNDFLYIHGGLDVNNSLLADMWCFSKNSWRPIKQIDRIPEPRYAHSLIFSVYGNAKLVFLFGGNKKGYNAALGDTWIFNINTNRWKEITNSSGSKPCARWGHSSQLFDNEWMIIYGGITNGWIDNYALSDMYALNIFTFSWFEVDISTSKNFDRGYYGSLCFLPYKKSLFVFGGTDNSDDYSDVFSMSPLVTYVSYKALTGKIEQLNTRMKNINETSSENENINISEFETKITELKEDINKITFMMKAFEAKFCELEKLNEQCEKLLSKNINIEELQKLEQRIRKLESSNVLMKHDSI